MVVESIVMEIKLRKCSLHEVVSFMTNNSKNTTDTTKFVIKKITAWEISYKKVPIRFSPRVDSYGDKIQKQFICNIYSPYIGRYRNNISAIFVNNMADYIKNNMADKSNVFNHMKNKKQDIFIHDYAEN